MELATVGAGLDGPHIEFAVAANEASMSLPTALHNDFNLFAKTLFRMKEDEFYIKTMHSLTFANLETSFFPKKMRLQDPPVSEADIGLFMESVRTLFLTLEDEVYDLREQRLVMAGTLPSIAE
jgi:hypothetical protein